MHVFTIKAATPADIAAIQEIVQDTWEPTYRHIIAAEQIQFMKEEIFKTPALQQQMAAGQRFFILFENEVPVGFASYSPDDAQIFKLNKIYIKPAYQGRGYGSLLIRHVEQDAQSRGGKYLILNVNRHNNARQMYERLGFKVIREEDIPIGAYWMNDYVMQKEISDGG